MNSAFSLGVLQSMQWSNTLRAWSWPLHATRPGVMADALFCFTRKCRAYMRPAYKQRVREFVKGGRAALVNHSLDESLRLKDARNRPSGDPNCELFPQGPVIPVPPSTPLYRPVGAYGNNWAVSPDRHAKRKPPNQRVRRPLFPLFRWWLCSMAMPK